MKCEYITKLADVPVLRYGILRTIDFVVFLTEVNIRERVISVQAVKALEGVEGQDTKMRFSVMPYPGDSGFTQWHDAMKMVARLPGGIPPEFRRRLWLTLAEKHLQARGVNWCHAERFCFNEWSNPDDDELGIQIVKDLHRTGCSLFCGAEAEQNQALLKRVLLAYARWNKAVGYCQGFNMLAALILQVMDRSESDAVKVMIYLIEGVLPESYFANNLRGLSVDMAVFRDLLRLRLPSLSHHLEQLQHDARDSATGTSYEPPLTNVFTMQWFLTLFSNCLPQTTVLRVWDLIFLEGNEVLLRTALAIWDGLADRILAVDSADEFYSIMGVLTREMLEFGLMDTNNLVKTIVTIAPFPFPELSELRDKYLYNITPWTQTVSTAAKRGLKLFYSDDDEETDEDEEKIAVAAAYGISTVFRSPRRRDSINRTTSPSTSLSALNYSALAPDKDRLALDISALKQQYAKLRERQRQAHIILTAACARQPLGPSVPTPVAMNHLLLGKSALMSMRGRRVGPPPGAVPPPANASLRPNAKPRKAKQPIVTLQGQLITPSSDIIAPQSQTDKSGETLHWKDAIAKKRVRRSSEDTGRESSTRPADTEEVADIAPSIIVPAIVEPEIEEEETASSKSNASSDGSSTSTELCDEPDRLSDFDSEDLTSISDASSYAPDIARLSTLPESKSPVSPESTLHFAPSSDESTSSEYKPTSRKDFARSSSLDKSMDFITEKKEVAISQKTSENNLLDTCVSPLSVNKLHPLISSDLHESITIKTCKQISPTKEQIIVSSSVESSKANTIQMSAKSGTEKESHETQLHSGKSETSFTDSESAEIVHRLHSRSPSNETAAITSQPLYSQVPNDNLNSEPKKYEQLFTKENKVAQTIEEENLAPSNISIDNIVGGILETELTNVFSGMKDNKESSPTDDYIIPEGTVKDKELSEKSPDRSLSSVHMEKSLENKTDESQGPKNIELNLRNEEILKSPDEVNNTEKQGDLGDHKDRSIDDVDMSVLLEINHRLHCQEKDLQLSLEALTAELKDSPDKGNNRSEKEIIDYAKMSELLEIDQKMNLGRRNSERALKIIQENSEILQRILQCQARRPSKLSEEGSNGVNVHSEDDSTDANSSVPTTSSLENVNIVPSSPSRLNLDDEKPVQKISDEEREYLLTDDSGSKLEKLEITDSDFFKDIKKQISPDYQDMSNYLEDRKEPTRYSKVFSADSKDPPFHHSAEESTALMTERKYVTERSSVDHPKPVEDTLGSLNKFKATLRPLLLSPDMDHVSAKTIPHDPKVSDTGVKLDDLSPLHLQTTQNISEDLHKNHSIFSSTRSDEPLSTRYSYDSKSDKMSLYDQYDFHLFSQKGSLHTSSDQAKTLTKSLYSFEEDMKPTTKFSNVTDNYEKYNIRTGDSSGTSFHFQSHITEKSSHSMEFTSTKYSAKSSSPLSSRNSFLDSLSFTDRLSAYESSKETKKQSYSITPPHSEISRLDSPPLNIDTLAKETIDYFHLDSSSILSSPTKPGSTAWTDSPRHTHISSPSSRRRESDELFRRRPSSSSPKRRTSEDFQFDLRPFLTSSVSDSRTDLVHTKLARESRPSSPIVSECFPEMLNRSSSSSSLHGFHSKSKKDLSSPPPSPFQRYTPPLRRSMSRERPVSLHFDSDISFDLTKESVSHGRTSSPLYKSFSMLSVNETVSPFETSYEKLDKSHSRRRTSTDYSHSLPRTKGKLSRITSPTYSPTKSKEFNFSLPPLKTPTHNSPIKSPMKFNPFPPRPSMQKPKELGVKLGLYPVTGEGVRGKVLEKST
ncbi:uncharacterized protein [Anabrus simplex]|uniref:uncharacterized protein n=1 Tax=Anabrus simplex TaxID=316456 RepID=UPI0035A2960E